jgi:hypothetical protein
MKFSQELPMHTSAKKRKHGLVLAILAITLLLAVFWYISKTPEREANRVIRSLWTVQLGQTPVEKMTQTLPGRWVTGTPKDSRSGYGLTLRNDLLHSLKLAPIAGVTVDIGADKGIIDEMQIYWAIGESGNTAEVRFFQVASHEPECGQKVCVRRWNGQDGRPWKIQVDASPTTPPAERNRFLSFNTACLSRIGGCKDARELLPTAAARN